MRLRYACLPLGFLLLIPTQAPAAPLSDVQLSELRAHVLTMINENRVEEGLQPLQYDKNIERVAQGHADDTAAYFDETNVQTREATYLGHTSSDGRALNARYRDTGVDTGLAFAENTGYWIREPFGERMEAARFGLKLIHEGMMVEVPPNDQHRENIIGPYTHIGIGLSLLNDEEKGTNAIFFVTNFNYYGKEELLRRQIESKQGDIRKPQRSLLGLEDREGVKPFPDISLNHPYAEAIAAMKGQRIVQGYPDGKFRPNRTVNRAEFLKMLMDALGFSPIGMEFNQCFSDVFLQWFAPYVCIAQRYGWVEGYPTGDFRPEQFVSRAEAVTMLTRVMALPLNLDAMVPFNDVPEDTWFWTSVQSVASNGFLPFPSGTFQPHSGMKRGEVAEMLYRATK